MGRKGGTNEKVQKANELKAANKAVIDAKKAVDVERETSVEWKKGANNRAASRAETNAAKAEEARRKKEAKSILMAAEEAEMSAISNSTKVVGNGQKAKAVKKKKKDDFSVLEESLVSSADKKTKKVAAVKRQKEREAELAKKKKEEEKLKQQQQVDPLFANTSAMIGNMDDEDDMVGRKLNKAIEGDASGIDAALGALSVGGAADAHPEKRMKAAYRTYEEKMLPVVKANFPGLRLTQYKEKIFTLWKKSPENPMNQQT